MARYEVQVIVEYNYEVEATSKEDAERQGWEYEDYKFNSEVSDINVSEMEDEDDDEE